MVEADLVKLDEGAGRPLDRLEADIWMGVEARIKARKVSAAVFSCQAVVLAIALLSSIAAGARTAMWDDPSSGLDAFSVRGDLAPSTLLLGH